MVKVFLVEDEAVIRNGIKNSIDWHSAGLEFAGEAADGELAWPLIKNTEPDILITDIKMPFMDGLELSRLVKKELPNTKIIILSGYNEFDYAKEAINIGITDYILKPITAAKLLEELNKVAETVNEEKQQRLYMEAFEKEHMENAQLTLQRFFYKLVGGKLSTANILKEASENGMDLGASCFNMMLFQMSLHETTAWEYSEKTNQLRNSMLELLHERDDLLIFSLEDDIIAFIFKGENEDAVNRSITEVIQTIESHIKEAQAAAHDDWNYFGGIGSAVTRLSQLKECYENAGRTFAFRYIMSRNQFIFADNPAIKNWGADAALNIDTINVGKLDQRIIEDFLKSCGIKSEIPVFTEEFFASIGHENMDSLLFRQYVLMKIYFVSVAFVEELGYTAKDLSNICGDINDMKTVFSSAKPSMDYARKILEAAIELRDRTANQKYSNILKEATNYIRENYDDENMSLNTVASSVNLSPNHFSTVFSQQMKQTFIEYLTNVRMEKARELLKTTSMRSAEIAYSVGYKDPHYFSYLFKKTQGCTPREFRQKR